MSRALTVRGYVAPAVRDRVRRTAQTLGGHAMMLADAHGSVEAELEAAETFVALRVAG